jgi:hypothetical protein
MLQATICPQMAPPAAPPGCAVEWYKDANGCDLPRVVCPKTTATSAAPPMEQLSAKRRWGTIATVILGGSLLLFVASWRSRRG